MEIFEITERVLSKVISPYLYEQVESDVRFESKILPEESINRLVIIYSTDESATNEIDDSELLLNKTLNLTELEFGSS